MTNPSLAFLWHMHQPYYRNMIGGECIQPWTRLHGIHSYYDMMKLYEGAPDICANINFVPSLLKQLCEYAENGRSDKFMAVSQIDAKELAPDEKIFILRNFFMANPERMIRPHPRYTKLYQRRGENTAEIDFENAIRYFSWKDYLDIQVYYNLVWFGFKARSEFPEIEKMLSVASSGNAFTEDDKKFVLNTQLEVLKRLLCSIRNAPPNIELTTTPFCHPILPLLLDTNIAKRCMPKATLPPRFSMPKAALFQIQHGLTLFEKIVGKRPEGMWPAEGSVCPEMIPMLAGSGVKWIATDEGILERSDVSGKKANCPYQPYTAEHDGASVSIVFRDRELSDLIGFSYSKIEAERAANDFAERIKSRTAGAAVPNPLVTVLLDGENPWEGFERGGERFLTAMIEKLRSERIKTTTISNHLRENPPERKINKLHSGSWINSDYGIWIGKPQKNKAWEFIKRTADELGPKLSGAFDNAGRTEAELVAIESLCAGCGSDWFWWFDDDFESEFKSDFDKIFRMHLKNTFALLGCDVPVFLYEPIHHYKETLHDRGPVRPQGFVAPVIDGKNTSFFEWASAVKIDIGRHRGPMGQTKELFETIYFGFNREFFYLRLDPLDKDVDFSLQDGEEIAFYVHNGDKNYKIRLFRNGKDHRLEFVNSPSEGYPNGQHKANWAVGHVFEMGLSFGELGFKQGEKLTLIITVVRGGIEVRHYSHIVFAVPDENYESQMWSV